MPPIRSVVRSALPALALAAALAGCASSNGAPNPSYAGDMARLQSGCDARGGVLTPTNRLTGRPETDYVCTIHDGGGRLQP